MPTAESKHDVAAPAAAKVAAPRLPLSTSVPVYQTAASEVASVTSHSYTAPSAAPCPIDERGRPRCPGDHAREAISLKDRGSELAEAAQEFGAAVIRTAVKGAKKTARYRLGRTGAALFALVSALLAQLATLLIEDAIVKTGEYITAALSSLLKSAETGQSIPQHSHGHCRRRSPHAPRRSASESLERISEPRTPWRVSGSKHSRSLASAPSWSSWDASAPGQASTTMCPLPAFFARASATRQRLRHRRIASVALRGQL